MTKPEMRALKSGMGVSPIRLFEYENHGRDARATNIQSSQIRINEERPMTIGTAPAEPPDSFRHFPIRHSSLIRISSFVIRISLALTFSLALSHATPASAQTFQQALSPRPFSFPLDHGRHDGFKIEWWYFTGNLQDSAGRRFGYQLTFFRSAFAPGAATRPSPWAMNDLYFAHAAVSDIAARQFHFDDALQRARPGLAWASADSLDVALLNWSARQSSTSNAIHLAAAAKDFSIDLTTDAGRGPFLEGPGGVNRKGRAPGQASYYYSITRLHTAGTLTVAGRSYTVTGLSWMDHEFSSNSLGKQQAGWDWMGLQLDDGTDLMIYRLRNRSGATDYLSGTRVGNDGAPHYLSDQDLSITGAAPWRSDRSSANYPQVWRVNAAGLPPLTVKSEMPGQELVTSDSTDVTYFEGAARVLDAAGRPIGAGYLEMTGYDKPITGRD
jgi:predicted secreted hydrolase